MPDLQTLMGTCSQCGEACEGIDRRPASGIYPRGFYYDFAAPARRLLVIANCPGTVPDDDIELQATRRRTAGGEDPLKITLEMTKEALFGSAMVNHPIHRWDDNPFHENLSCFLCEVFRCSRERLQEHVSFTNVVKCPASENCGDIPASTYRKCRDRYLLRELRVLNPRTVIVNGAKARDYMEDALNQYGVPYVCIPHTSSNRPAHWGREWRRSRWPWLARLGKSPRYLALDELHRALTAATL